MRPKFGHILGEYSDIAKRKPTPPEGSGDVGDGAADAEYQGELDAFTAELEQLFARAIARRRSTHEAQEQIFALQEEKQRVMMTLRERLEAIRNREHGVPPDGSRIITRDATTGDYQWRDPIGSTWSVPLGAIMTDARWGIAYHLDPDTVPESVQKRFVVEHAKRELLELLNAQITTDELASETVLAAKKITYAIIDSGIEHYGNVAEHMVEIFLTKLTVDHDVDFTVERVDVFDDVERKIDFVIHRRGEVPEGDPKSVGIQFTLSESEGVIREKHRKISGAMKQWAASMGVDGTALVQFPMRDVTESLRIWERHGKPPGGPDGLWSVERKEEVFRAVLRFLFSDEELDAMWMKISRDRGWAEEEAA